MKKFTDNLIPERIRIIKSDKNPVHVYEMLEKHYGHEISTLQSRYKISVHVIRNEITIEGSTSYMCEILNYLDRKGCKFKSVTETSLVVDIDNFFRKIY